MFECPKCGFKDSACWRNSRYVIYAVYCTLDELTIFEPEIAVMLQHEKEVVNGPYLYRKRGRANHIYRIHKELRDFLDGHGITEKPKHKDPFQKTLAVDGGKQR
jgi:hypothetical protein